MATPKWSLTKEEYLSRLDMVREEEFEDFFSIPSIGKVSHIVPLRFLKSARALIPMQRATLTTLITKVRTRNNEYPFKDASIDFRKIDSRQLFVGQRFVYRERYQEILEGMPRLFDNYLMPHGIVNLGAYFIFGEDHNGATALACYTPPFVERHNSRLVIMDGIHRNFLAKQIGATIATIVVENVRVPFPCSAMPWSEIALLPYNNKPQDVRERFFDLNENLFRDLKYLGIDG